MAPSGRMGPQASPPAPALLAGKRGSRWCKWWARTRGGERSSPGRGAGQREREHRDTEGREQVTELYEGEASRSGWCRDRPGSLRDLTGRQPQAGGLTKAAETGPTANISGTQAAEATPRLPRPTWPR